MHLPDGFVSAPVAAATGLISATAVGWALRRVRRRMGEETVPLLGVTAAFVFAAQMVNFPVAAGTSGHVLGAALAMVLLGPAAGLLAMTVAELLQALLFADGGITAAGANLFCMAMVGGWGAWGMLRLAVRLGLPARWLPAAAGVAAWASLVFASAACGGVLALSGILPAPVVLPAMIGVHALIGIGEGLVTASALGLIVAWRPDLVALRPALAGGGIGR